MSLPLSNDASYKHALHDLVEAAKLALDAREKGLCSGAGVEQILRDDLAYRWQVRIDRGELPPCYSAEMVVTVTEAAASFFRKPTLAGVN